MENPFHDSVRPLVVGNWKMHGLAGQLRQVAEIDESAGRAPGCEVVVCTPATLLCRAAAVVRHLAIGAQDCHALESGAHTGSLSAAMLADAGAGWVIVGHSESRQALGLRDRDVAAKLQAATASLRAIMCVGENSRGEAGGIDHVVGQLELGLPDGIAPERLAVAYEPVWAIGSGLVPDAAWIRRVHAALRQVLHKRFPGAAADLRILYGGSVNAGNARELCAIPGVDGVLVGGASLDADSFGRIIRDVAHGREPRAPRLK